MADTLTWRFPSSIWMHLASYIPPTDNPLSLLANYHHKGDLPPIGDSDIIRQAGIKDALGQLSPAFQRTLGVLTDPEAYIGITFSNNLLSPDIRIYYGKNFNRAVSVSEIDEQVHLADPADFDEIIQKTSDIVGLCSRSFSNFKTSLPIDEAIIFSAIIDLTRKSNVQNFLQNKPDSQNAFSPQVIEDHSLRHKDNPRWLVSLAQSLGHIVTEPGKTNILAQELVSKNLCIPVHDGFILSEIAENATNTDRLIEKIVTINVKRYFMKSRLLTEIHQRWIQSGVNDILLFTFEKSNIQIEQTSSRSFQENLSFMINGGVTQIPEPKLEFETSEATYILGISENIWQLVPKDTGKPITLKNTVRIGRNPDNQIIFNEPSVSRIHAQFDVKGDECWISDLNSRNGTVVNNIKIKQPTKLKHKDTVKIGPYLFEIRVVPSETLPTQSLPIPNI